MKFEKYFKSKIEKGTTYELLEARGKYALYLRKSYGYKYGKITLAFFKLNRNGLEEVILSLYEPEILNFPEVNQPIDTELLIINSMICKNAYEIRRKAGLDSDDELPDYLQLYDYHYTDVVNDEVFIWGPGEKESFTITLVGGVLNKKEYIGFEIFDEENRYRCAILDQDLTPLYGEGYLYCQNWLVNQVYEIIQGRIGLIEYELKNEFELNEESISEIINDIKNGKENLYNLNPDPEFIGWYNKNKEIKLLMDQKQIPE